MKVKGKFIFFVRGAFFGHALGSTVRCSNVRRSGDLGLGRFEGSRGGNIDPEAAEEEAAVARLAGA